jgi:acetyl-CoA acetyltransferase
MTEFGKQPDRDLKELVSEAVDGALADSSCPADEVELVYFGNVLGGLMQRQESCRGQIWTSDSVIGGAAVVNVENACGSGGTALHQAWMSVAGGFADVAVALGAEKMFDSGTRRALESMTATIDQSRVDAIKAEVGAQEPGDSLFMHIYARFAIDYSERTGATQEDFARVSAKNHANSEHNPKAQYRTPVSVEEVLAARAVAGPLTLPMCAPISDGAAAAIVTTPERAANWGAEAVRVLGIGIAGCRVGSYGVLPKAAARAYRVAGIDPKDVDVLECHDAAAPAEMIAMEELGLCAPGAAPAMVRAGETTLRGSLPINPSGGLESRGHPLGATGLAQVIELCDQLRGRAGARQVEDPMIAVAENAGGYLGPDLAFAGVTVLARS